MTIADDRVEPPRIAQPDDLRSPLSLPGSRYPTGWFQVGWSDDLPPGEMRLVHYFGQDLLLWRAESGVFHVSDPYCLHLGANIGVRGTVEGEEIVCPWHGWHWDGDGRNTLIPYSAQKCKPNLQIKTWPVQEWYGCLVVWHDEAGGDPSWQPAAIPDLEDGSRYPFTAELRHSWQIVAHPQLVMENGVDAAHVHYIHGAGEVPVIKEVDVQGHVWRTEVSVTYGAGKGSTWLTPDGAIEATMSFDLWGIGLGLANWPDELLGGRMITNPTPIDDTHTELWWCMTTTRTDGDDAPSKAAMKMIEHQRVTVEQDFFTWANMKVLHTPNFAPEEAKYYAAIRRWARQFYPGLEQNLEGIRSPGANGNGDGGR
ncbi:MAG: aromatic ring-hydroxylating oxygenase subunit alpha [Acidimicrobiales bacterium]